MENSPVLFWLVIIIIPALWMSVGANVLYKTTGKTWPGVVCGGGVGFGFATLIITSNNLHPW